MKRGFKAHAEREAARVRTDLGLPAAAPLPSRDLASKLAVRLISPLEIPDLSGAHLEALRQDAGSWSAVTLPALDPVCIIYNPFHAATRHESDIMHELAHLLCDHRPDGVMTLGGLPCRSFSKVHEEEAAWLGATLQAPRVALMALFRRGMSVAQVAAHLGCSEVLVRYRRDVTGVERQVGRAGWRPARAKVP